MTRPVGMCSVCGQPQAVTNAGTIFGHKDYGLGRSCTGSFRDAVRGSVRDTLDGYKRDFVPGYAATHKAGKAEC